VRQIRSRCRADPVAQTAYANGLRAMLAAEEGAVLLEAVPDDADAAVLAGRRQRMDRAFETVERRSRADAWLCGHPRDRHDGLRQELAARMTKKRRVYRHHTVGNQVMRPTDLGSNFRLRMAGCFAQCLNLEHEIH
jgi:hypothetical protein